MSDPLQTGHRVIPEDRSGILYVVVWLGLIYTSLALITRLAIKWKMFGLDDGAMLIAQIVNAVQFTLLHNSLSNGLAKSFATITSGQYSRMALTYYGGQIAIYISLGISKISTILLVRRVFRAEMKKERTICNVVVCAMFVWTISSALVVSAGCSAESLSPKTPSQVCSGIGNEARYMVIVVTDAITDLVLAIIPAYLCRHVQMKPVLKLQVLFIFALRLPLLALAGLFFKYWKISLNSDDIGVARTMALVFQQSQLCVSLIAGTIPCLKSFMNSFDTGSGVKVRLGRCVDSSGYGTHSSFHSSSCAPTNYGESYQMYTLNDRRNGDSGAKVQADNGKAPGRTWTQLLRRLRTEGGIHDMEMDHRDTQEFDGTSQTSKRRLVIRKTVG
ncbi:hypothetical protein M3J09_011586 [Ascochyta lentis]